MIGPERPDEPSQSMLVPGQELPSAKEGAASLARSASVLSLGNVASRVLGLVREMIIASYFGATGEVSAFRVASQVPMLVYDFLVGGMLSASLVPTLSEYAQPERRTEFVQLVGTLLSIFTVVLALLVLGLEWAAPTVARLLAGGFEQFDPTLLPLTTRLIRLITPAVWLFGLAGVLTAILYALQRFTFPAIATATYNLGIVIATPLLAPHLGILSLILGILAGSLAQLLLMGWDLLRWRRQEAAAPFWQWAALAPAALAHPALAKMLRLYLPIAAGLIVTMFQIGLDRRLASSTGEQSIAWMQNATTLQQLPLGLISVAIALAALPRLSYYFADGDDAAYRATLGRGLRMVLLLMIPAAVGLWLLGTPVTRLVFERGRFTASDTVQVVSALNIYLVGMLFAAIDFPLNYAFYARNNTLLPALVGVLSVGVYVFMAFALLDGMGYLGLVWADTAKQASHALIMVLLLGRTLGRLNGGMPRGLVQLGGAGLVMGSVIVVMTWLLGGWLPPTLAGDATRLVLVGGSGVVAYGAVLTVVGLPEVGQLWRFVTARFLQ